MKKHIDFKKSLKEQLFQRSLSSRIIWGINSALAIFIGYFFSGLNPATSTIFSVANGLSLPAYVAGGWGLLMFTVLGLDKRKVNKSATMAGRNEKAH